MPTYEYACRSCGHAFEVVQSMSDDPLTTCPVCEGQLRKIFAPPAIAFKGSGFYATDHGKNKAKPSEGSPEKKDDTKKGDTKTDGAKGEGAKKDAGSTAKEGSTSGSSPAPKKEATS